MAKARRSPCRIAPEGGIAHHHVEPLAEGLLQRERQGQARKAGAGDDDAGRTGNHGWLLSGRLPRAVTILGVHSSRGVRHRPRCVKPRIARRYGPALDVPPPVGMDGGPSATASERETAPFFGPMPSERLEHRSTRKAGSPFFARCSGESTMSRAVADLLSILDLETAGGEPVPRPEPAGRAGSASSAAR